MGRNTECEYIGIYCLEEKCFLRDELIFFSDNGGFSDPSLSNVGGRYHSEKEFADRVRQIMTRSGKLNCKYQPEIADSIDRIIKSKSQRGELVADTNQSTKSP